MPSVRTTGGGLRLLGVAAQAGAALWLLAAPLILANPSWLPAEQAYGTVVAAAAVLLVAGATGARRRFGWPRTRLFAGFMAIWRRLDRVLDPAHEHRTERGLRDVPGHSTSARIGVMLLRFGLVLVAVTAVQLAADVVAWRPTFWFGWFLTHAGAVALGLAVAVTALLPRRGGILLAVGGLAAFKATAVVVGGAVREPESLGPLLPLEVGTPWMVALAMVLWLSFGLGWWEIGRGLRETPVEDRGRLGPP